MAESDGDQHEVVLARPRGVHDAGRGPGPGAAHHVVGGQAVDGDAVGTRRVAQDVDGMAGRTEVRPVHRADHTGPDD